MSAEPLHVAPRPCNTCPYLRSTPAGVWSADEYEKLPLYDDDAEPFPAIATFHCHQENATGVPTVCRGWLSTHADSIAVRIAIVDGRIDPAAIPRAPEPEMYATGVEARDAGMADIEQPSAQAQRAMRKLLRRGAAR